MKKNEDIEALIALASTSLPKPPEKPADLPKIVLDLPPVFVKPKRQKASYSSIEEFILSVGIEKGQKKVINTQLLRVYNLWAEKPLGKINFYKEISKYFPLMRKRTYKYYLLNGAAWQFEFKVKNDKEKKLANLSRT